MTDARPPLCLYHDDHDGAAAAWCVLQVHPDAQCVPVQYSDLTPAQIHELRNLVTNRDVWIVDFSYPSAVLQVLSLRATSLTVIDHHQTARFELLAVVGVEGAEGSFDLDYGAVRVVYDVERSGAGLTWDTLFPGRPRPWFIDFVEDRDLWRWALPNSKAINAFLGTWPSTPKSFFRLVSEPWADLDEDTKRGVSQSGVAVVSYKKQLVRRICENATTSEFRIQGTIDKVPTYVEVPTVNSPVLQSEVGNELCQGKPFAGVWWETADGDTRWSLRSDEDGLDVGEIAKAFGGGGHRHAAG